MNPSVNTQPDAELSAPRSDPDRRPVRWLSLALLLLICLAVRLAIAPLMMNDFDRKDYVSNAHKTLRYGVANYYEPNPNYKGYGGVPSSYPPLQIYFYAMAGHLYQRFVDPSFYDITYWRNLPFDSLPLNYLIKAPIFLFELLLIAVIFLWVRRKASDRAAMACAALYGLNPAVLYDGALWEQPDALHCAFLSLAIIFLIKRNPVACLTMLALALMSKPQPTVFVPLVALVVLTRSTLRQTMLAALAAVATVTLVFLPYLANGAKAIAQMLKIMYDANPVVSAQAHNFWWLVLAPQGANPLEIPDSAQTFLGVSYFAISMLILLVFYSGVATRLLKTPLERLTSEPFAYTGLLFFVFAVRAHENHAIQVLPLLLLTGLALWHQRVIFAALTLTILANMMLHSPEIVGEQSSRLVESMRVLNAALCVSIFAYWTYTMFRPRAVIESPA